DSMNDTLHLVHPRPTTWGAVMAQIASIMNVPLVPYREWLARLKGTAEFASQGTTALKLLDMFELGLKSTVNRESMGMLPNVMSNKG
ncbi:hypothetical protein C8R47DRAFT_946332, partial [Mycena vitilis]